jgi:hypothetical protein
MSLANGRAVSRFGQKGGGAGPGSIVWAKAASAGLVLCDGGAAPVSASLPFKGETGLGIQYGRSIAPAAAGAFATFVFYVASKNTWLCGQQGSNLLRKSTDNGATWTTLALAGGQSLFRAAANGNRVVIVGTDTNGNSTAWYSDDLVTWISVYIQGGGQPNTFIYAFGKFFVTMGSISWGSVDGTAWTGGNSTTVNPQQSILYSGRVFWPAAGEYLGSTTDYANVSYQQIGSTGNNTWNGFAAGNGICIMTGNGGNQGRIALCAAGNDPTVQGSWNPVAFGQVGITVWSPVFLNGLFVVQTSIGPMFSATGAVWTASTSAATRAIVTVSAPPVVVGNSIYTVGQMDHVFATVPVLPAAGTHFQLPSIAPKLNAANETLYPFLKAA